MKSPVQVFLVLLVINAWPLEPYGWMQKYFFGFISPWAMAF